MKINFNLTMFKFCEQNKGDWENQILWQKVMKINFNLLMLRFCEQNKRDWENQREQTGHWEGHLFSFFGPIWTLGTKCPWAMAQGF